MYDKPLTGAAALSRGEALARHRAEMSALRDHTKAEIERVNTERDRQVNILNEMLCVERTLRRRAARAALLFKGLMVVAGVCAAVVATLLIHERQHPRPWRTYTPPVDVPIQVVTRGWYNKKGQYQSYDNGEVITVKHWQPE